MNCSQHLLRSLRATRSSIASKSAPQCARTAAAARILPPRAVHSRRISSTVFRSNKQPAAEDPNFVSIVDLQPQTVRAGKRHGAGIILLGSYNLLQTVSSATPSPLPPHIDPSVVNEFDYRRVLATGRFRHDQEMLVGPRMRDGQDGFMVITPLERKDGSTILVNRGWISKKHRSQKTRPDSLVQGTVTVEGLLREPWKKNMFTPENRPDKGEFYFPDVHQMAALTGSQPVWIEATMEPEFMRMMDYEARGVPFGRPAEVNLRNNHAQYIFTWYGLSIATSIMLYMVLKKPPSNVARRVRASGHM
ncbi:hypothetical protein TrVGV298_001834 [Trichoderma virens]|nr:hypothetical protein TrVGV298_001834 [Trichoderma virens]